METYLETCQTSIMKFFCKKDFNYLGKKISSQIFDRVLNTPQESMAPEVFLYFTEGLFLANTYSEALQRHQNF